ncbi:MAG: TIR domain-containing protein [Candidatus Paceibacterota bacterium]
MKSQYNIAISFAGEDRPIAEKIASGLRSKDLIVFYDEYEQANLWGKDLYQHLSEVYSEKAEYCIILISEYYIKKNWTKLELRSAQERAFKENREYILPVRLDDTKVPGLSDTIGYLNLNNVGVDGVIDATLQKIGKKEGSLSKSVKPDSSKNNQHSFGSPRMPDFKKEFTDKDKEDFLHEGFSHIKTYFRKGLESIEKNNAAIETSFTEIHALKFTGKVYLNGKQKIKFMIWVNNDQSIAYREGYRSIDDNSTNEMIYVKARKSELSFEPMYMGFPGPNWKRDSPFLDQKEIAKFLWDKVMYKIENA